MMQLQCKNCNGVFQAPGLMGSTPPQIPLYYYCSEKCLAEAHEKNKDKSA